MKIEKFIKVFGIALIVYGVYNLLGIGNFTQFTEMLKGLPGAVRIAVYAFSVFYGVSCVYCGLRIMKTENWARKVIVALTSISVLVGFAVCETVTTNFRGFVFSESSGIPPHMAGSVYRYAVAFTVITMIFELAVIVFFTRPGVVEKFKG